MAELTPLVPWFRVEVAGRGAEIAWRDRVLAESAVASQGLWTLRCACAVCEVALVGGDQPGQAGVRVRSRRVRSHPVDTDCARRGVRSHPVRGVWGAVAGCEVG